MGIRLAIITDLHHGRDTGKVRGPEALGLLKKIAKQICDLKPDAVIELGDRLTDDNPTADTERLVELAEVFKELPFARHHLSGNHDMLPKAEQEAILQTNLGNHLVEMGEWTLIFLETYDATAGGLLSLETLAWLEQNLNKVKHQAVIFSHQPLHGQWHQGNPYFEEEYREHACAKNAELARTIFEKSGKVRLCVSGHAHWFDLRQVGGIPYLTLLGPTESHWSNGQVSQAWSVLHLDTDIQLEQFGKSPQNIQIKNPSWQNTASAAVNSSSELTTIS